MSQWEFLGALPSRIVPIQHLSGGQIADAGGIYVLSAADATAYTYPKGSSSIFYIGLATNLRKRLTTHRRRTRRVVRQTAGGIDRPRYEYAAAHGCMVAAFPVDSTIAPDLRAVESSVIGLFAARYGAPPIANGTSNRESVLRRSSLKPPLGLTNDVWFHDARILNGSAPKTRNPRVPDGQGAKTIELVERVVRLAQTVGKDLVPNRKVNYTGFLKAGQPYNFATCRPRGSHIRLDIVLPFSDHMIQTLEPLTSAGLRYDSHRGAYVCRLSGADLTTHAELLRAVLREAYEARGA